MKKTLVVSLFALATTCAWAQNPFKSIGIPDSEVPVMTLSNGEFPEFHDQERYVQIGEVLFDTQTMTLSDISYEDTTYSEATLKPEVISRWLAPDPLRQYPSPYKGMGNDPVNRVDPDGGLDKFLLGKDGSITYVDDTGGDVIDYLVDTEGNLVGEVNPGFLKDGINLAKDFNFIEANNLADFDSYLDFTLDLSMHVGKEISAYFAQSPNGGVDNIFLHPYIGNTDVSSGWSIRRAEDRGALYVSRDYVYRDLNFKVVGWYHTHPGIKEGQGFGVPSPGDIIWTRDNLKVPGIINSKHDGRTFINTDGTWFIYGK